MQRFHAALIDSTFNYDPFSWAGLATTSSPGRYRRERYFDVNYVARERSTANKNTKKRRLGFDRTQPNCFSLAMFIAFNRFPDMNTHVRGKRNHHLKRGTFQRDSW